MDASTEQRIDLLTLSINLGGDKASIRELLELFLKSNTDVLQKMEQAEEADNLIAWLQLAHKMKGASNYIGARRLATLCLEAEGIKKLPHEHSGAIHYHLCKEMAHLRDEISRHLSHY